MNRFFSSDEYRRDYPSRAFVRLDDPEPLAPGPRDALTFNFDAVDADWSSFGSDGQFPLNGLDLKQHAAGMLDSGHFGTARLGGYDGVPTYRIELSLEQGGALSQFLPRSEEPWVTFALSNDPRGLPVDVYGGMFAPPMQAFHERLRTCTTRRAGHAVRHDHLAGCRRRQSAAGAGAGMYH